MWEEREKNEWALSPSIPAWAVDWKAVPSNERSTMERLVILGEINIVWMSGLERIILRR